MPLGTPLPPPLPLPPPPRPSRLSWPGPRCLPRTIVPSTAAGGGRGAGRGTQEALRGAGRGCGVRRPGGLAGTMNQAPQTHSPRSSSPGRQESPFCRAAAAAFLGMARPGRRSGRAGGEAGSCPSFLPFFEVKIPSSRWGGERAPRPGRAPLSASSARRRTWASGAATLPGSTSPRRRPGLAHLLPRALGKRPGGGRGAEGVVGAGATAPTGSGGSRTDGAQRPAARHARRPFPPRGSQSAARRPGGTPSGPARPAARRWLSARVHARRLLAGGPQRLSSPATPGPAHRTPCARVPGGRGNSEGLRGAAATRPGPGSCHFCQPPTSERARETERKGGGRKAEGNTASSPRGTSERGRGRAACPPGRRGCPGPCRPRPRSPPPPPRPQPPRSL